MPFFRRFYYGPSFGQDIFTRHFGVAANNINRRLNVNKKSAGQDPTVHKCPKYGQQKAWRICLVFFFQLCQRPLIRVPLVRANQNQWHKAAERKLFSQCE
jgi:hypothetical protein